MDKNTLSNYGWVVCVILVLAIMISLATPFGTVIKDGVAKTVENFKSDANDVLDNMGGATSFDDLVGSGGAHGGNADKGSFMPDPDPTHEPPEYDEEVVVGDYTYFYCAGSDFFSFEDGWVVGPVNDATKTEYSDICETIYGKPVIGMSRTFYDCENITTFPDIPKTVRTLERPFPSGIDTVNGTLVIPETVVECSIGLTDVVPLKIPATCYAFLVATPDVEEYYPKGFELSNKKVYDWSGESFEPDHAAPQNGEQVIIGDFLYCYNYTVDSSGHWCPYYDTDYEGCVSGWTVMPINFKASYDPSKICSSVYGKPVVTAAYVYTAMGDCDTVTVPSSVTAITGASFAASNINTVNIPASVTHIAPDCFNSSTIQTINFEAGEAPEGFVCPAGAEVNFGVEM